MLFFKKKTKVFLVYGEDSVAFYFNGIKKLEGHGEEVIGDVNWLRQFTKEICKGLKWKYKDGEVDTDWLEERGSFPDELKEVVFE